MKKEELINHILQNTIKNIGPDLSTKLHGLSKGEIGTLYYLTFIEDNISAGVLAEMLQISSARVAKLLNTLEKKNYIIRVKDEHDKRKIVVKITDDGKNLITSMRNNVCDMLSYIIDEIGMDDILTYLNITKKIKLLIMEKEGGKVCCR